MTGPPRGRRFPLRLPLWFRAGAREPWRRAKTLAISGTGVSFIARTKLALGTRLHMRFIVGLRSVCSEVACRGRIVRLKRSLDNPGALTYSATIDSYRFNPVKAGRSIAAIS